MLVQIHGLQKKISSFDCHLSNMYLCTNSTLIFLNGVCTYGQCAMECCISLVDLELAIKELIARMKILVVFKLFTSYLFAHFLVTRPSAFINVHGKSTIFN